MAAAAQSQNCKQTVNSDYSAKSLWFNQVFLRQKTRENTRLVDERHQQTAALSKTWLYKVALALLTQLLRSVLYSLVYTTMLCTVVYSLLSACSMYKLGKYIIPLQKKVIISKLCFIIFLRLCEGSWKLQVIFDWLTASKIWIWWFLPVSGRFISCPLRPGGAPHAAVARLS